MRGLCVFKGLNLSMYEHKELVMNPTLQSLSRNMYPECERQYCTESPPSVCTMFFDMHEQSLVKLEELSWPQVPIPGWMPKSNRAARLTMSRSH